MTKAEYAEYLSTPHWQELKGALYAKRGKRCMACASKKHVEAHHVTYRSPITACTADDLMPLCGRCHELVHQSPIHNEACGLAGNDSRRAHVISSLRRFNSAPKPKPVDPNRLSKKQRRKLRKKERWLERQAKNGNPVSSPPVQRHPEPGSPAHEYEMRMAALRQQRANEDRATVEAGIVDRPWPMPPNYKKYAKQFKRNMKPCHQSRDRPWNHLAALL